MQREKYLIKTTRWNYKSFCRKCLKIAHLKTITEVIRLMKIIMSRCIDRKQEEAILTTKWRCVIAANLQESIAACLQEKYRQFVQCQKKFKRKWSKNIKARRSKKISSPISANWLVTSLAKDFGKLSLSGNFRRSSLRNYLPIWTLS